MNKTNAIKVDARHRAGRVQAAPFSADAARQAYFAHPQRIELAELARRFESAPSEVEVCGVGMNEVART